MYVHLDNNLCYSKILNVIRQSAEIDDNCFIQRKQYKLRMEFIEAVHSQRREGAYQMNMN